ncbi:enterochelin esterase [Streptoalloteichus hindustanus]|uniref:Enterochelin esterase n=1 Tax=Streptoalloteichus hindustanus TaxID=2017 RepID=A0A1M5FKA5_STRHI|nr:enterochelin esterase [Streptoalloteichus hindustanus]SHF91936.1 enterochelin esterase [Streptoalloteichus hindustanus]
MLVDSPRIAELAERPGDLAAFWAEVERRGTPLLEPADDGSRVVTFVWRGTPGTTDVLLLANRLTDRDNLAASRMRRLPGTDLWHLSYLLPDDYRGTYQIAPDFSGQHDADNAHWQRLMATARTDPFNPDTVDTGRNGLASSVVELPAAPEQPWWRPAGAPAGRVSEHRLTSTILGNSRSIWLYEPREASEGTLVLFDGNVWFPRLSFQHTLDNLIAAGAIPPVSAIGVDTIDVPTRRRELGGNPDFVTFLTAELLPWAGQRLGASPAADRTVVAGQSFGGLTALLAGHLAPDRFGNVLCQSPSLWRAQHLIDAYPAGRDIRLHLSVGRYERDMVDHTRALRDHLAHQGYPVSLTEYTGGHDFVCWRGCLADGLIELTGARDHLSHVDG